MGTSTKYPGPRGGQWKAANQRLGAWVSSIDRSAARSADGNGKVSVSIERLIQESDERAQELADQYRAALTAVVGDDPSAFGLRDRLRAGGDRLVDTLDSLLAGTAGWFSGKEDSAQVREEAFIRGFADQVAGPGGLVADTMVRQAAVACARELLDESGPLQEAVTEGKPLLGARISGDLFCLVFQLFFRDSVAKFITAIVAGKVRLTLAPLHLIDPAGKIADWVGQQVAAHIPDPCEKGAGLADAPSLADLARALVAESVDRALGIPVNAPGSAAA